MDPALSGPTVRVSFGGGGPCTTLSPGLRGGGLKSQFGRGLEHPGQESDGLVRLGTSGACVFGVPSWGH